MKDEKNKLVHNIILSVAIFSACFLAGCAAPKEDSTMEKTGDAKTLLVYSGAGLKDPMDEIAAGFTDDTGIKVTYIYGGSGVIFARIETEKTGDIFIPGSELKMQTAIEKGYVNSSKPVALHVPAIIVAAGNPLNISSLSDLARENIRVSLGKEDACAICSLSSKIFRNAGVYDGVQKNAVTDSRTTVNEIALDVVLGEADAAVVWASTSEGYAKQGKAESIEIENEANIIETVPIAVLEFSNNPEEAERFTEYVIERKDVWEKYGYRAAL